MTLTDRQGHTIAQDFKMKYSGPYYPEDTEHIFDEIRMLNSYWVGRNSFYFAENVQELYTRKLREYDLENADDSEEEEEEEYTEEEE